MLLKLIISLCIPFFLFSSAKNVEIILPDISYRTALSLSFFISSYSKVAVSSIGFGYIRLVLLCFEKSTTPVFRPDKYLATVLEEGESEEYVELAPTTIIFSSA